MNKLILFVSNMFCSKSNQLVTQQYLIEDLQEKYNSLLIDIKNLEEEYSSTTNELYRLENSLDARIDILAECCGCIEDV